MRCIARLTVAAAALAVTSAPSSARAAAPYDGPMDGGMGPHVRPGWMVLASIEEVAPLFHDTGEWSTPPYLGAGPALRIGGGYRWGFFYLGASAQHAFLGGGVWEVKTTSEQTLSASSAYVGADAMAFIGPDGPMGLTLRTSVGWRWVDAEMNPASEWPVPSRIAWNNVDVTLLGVGLQLHPVAWLRLVPEVSLAVGPFAYATAGCRLHFDFGGL